MAAMPPTRIVVLLVGLGILVVAALAIALLRDDGKRAALLAAPGLDLTFPHGTLLQQELPGRSVGGAGSYRLRCYGTDQGDAAIVAWYDAELARLGYQPVERTPDEQLYTQQQDKMIRQYQHGSFTYRLYLLPLPFKVGSRWLDTGYRHVLCDKLGN